MKTNPWHSEYKQSHPFPSVISFKIIFNFYQHNLITYGWDSLLNINTCTGTLKVISTNEIHGMFLDKTFYLTGFHTGFQHK